MPRRNPKKMRGTRKVDVIYQPVQRDLADALDPEKSSGKVVPFRDMPPDKQAEIMAKYKRK